MPDHPLIAIFQKRGEIKKQETFLPVPDEKIVEALPKSNKLHRMGCLVLAGGQGTRLGVEGPKGCVELPLKEKKSLFQIISEKVKAKGVDLPLAIMTSPLNHRATRQYLEDNDYFGLTNVEIFSQELIPMCDDVGKVFYEAKERIAKAPDGNGRALKNLYQSGVWEKWREQGVHYVQVMFVDNPLADPFDGEMLGVHEKEGVELVVKCVKRTSPDEKLGVLGVEKGRLMIREYSELTPRMRDLGFPLGNTGLFSCTMDFVKRSQKIDLPWHFARKQATRERESEKVWIWKFEAFIFDLFPHATSFKVIVADRTTCFAPLKNREGPNGLDVVAQAIETSRNSHTR